MKSFFRTPWGRLLARMSFVLLAGGLFFPSTARATGCQHSYFNPFVQLPFEDSIKPPQASSNPSAKPETPCSRSSVPGHLPGGPCRDPSCSRQDVPAPAPVAPLAGESQEHLGLIQTVPSLASSGLLSSLVGDQNHLPTRQPSSIFHPPRV